MRPSFFLVLRYRMTKRVHKSADGKYHVAGKAFDQLVGSRAQVWHGTAYKTAGGLKRHELTMNKWKRIVSKKKQKTARREKRLQKHGFFAKKGQFGFVRRAVATRRRRTRGNSRRRR